MSEKGNMELERKMIIDAYHKHSSELIDRISRTSRISKNVFFTNMMRNEGNIKFNSDHHTINDHEYIQAKYCMSIAVANPDSEEQSLAYGNRSAFLLHIGKIHECIQDIDRALRIAKTNTLKIKLLCRKVKCLAALNLPDAQKTLNKAKSVLKEGVGNGKTEQAFSKLINKAQVYLDEYDGNEKLDLNEKSSKRCSIEKINSFESVTLENNNKYGNHLIAARDIKPGQVIFVEKPYVTTINLHEAHFYCCHCFTLSWAMIPCDSCSWCMFCSENCKKEAWEKYHNIECDAFGTTKPNNEDDPFVQTSIRSLILAVREAGSVEKLRTILQLDSKDKNAAEYLCENRKIESNGFQILFHLSSDIQSLDIQRKFSIYALKVLLYLVIRTDILGKKFNPYQCRNLTENENVMFIGSLIFKLIKISYNCGRKVLNHGVEQKCGHTFGHPTEETCWYRGLCIATISSFINHSCEPNVSRCFTEDNNVIIYALQPIKKGTQLFECYEKTFYELPNPKRRNVLKQRYNFLCNCKPCKENWTTYCDFKTCLCKYAQKMKTPLELDLQKTNADTIAAVEETVNTDFTPEEISRLSTSIEKAIENLPQPSFITHKLIATLEGAFNRQYGGWIHIPDQCMKF